MAFRWWLFTFFAFFNSSVCVASDHLFDMSTPSGAPAAADAPAADFRSPGPETETYQYTNCQSTVPDQAGNKSAQAPEVKMLKENAPIGGTLRQFYFSMKENGGGTSNDATEYVFEGNAPYDAGRFKVWRGYARSLKQILPAGVTENRGTNGTVISYSYNGNQYSPAQVAPYIQRQEGQPVAMQYIETAGAPALRTFAMYKGFGQRQGGTNYNISVFNNRGDYSDVYADADSLNQKRYQTKKACRGRRSGYLPFAADANWHNGDDPVVPRNVSQEDLPYQRVTTPYGTSLVSNLNQRQEQLKLAQSLLEDSHYVSPAIQNFANSLVSGGFQQDPTWLLGQHVFAPVIYRP